VVTRQLRMSARRGLHAQNGGGPSRATSWWRSDAAEQTLSRHVRRPSATATPRSSAVPRTHRRRRSVGLHAQQRGMDPGSQKLDGKPTRWRRRHGMSVALSGDGDTAIIGGMKTKRVLRAAWGVAAQQWHRAWTHGKPPPPNWSERARWEKDTQGYSVAISATATRPPFGGAEDNGGFGAAWVFVRHSSKADRTNTHDQWDAVERIAWREARNIALWLYARQNSHQASVSSSQRLLRNNGNRSARADFDGEFMTTALARYSGNVAIWEMNGTLGVERKQLVRRATCGPMEHRPAPRCNGGNAWAILCGRTRPAQWRSGR